MDVIWVKSTYLDLGVKDLIGISGCKEVGVTDLIRGWRGSRVQI